MQGMKVSQTVEYSTIPPIATQKVKDSAGKVIGLCSMADGKIRNTSGKVIGKKTTEGKVELTDGSDSGGVRISAIIEYTPAPPVPVLKKGKNMFDGIKKGA
jgi:hypothetical protein